MSEKLKRYKKTEGESMSDMDESRLSSPMSMKPTVYFSFNDLPEAKEWEVGQEYEVDLKIKLISKTETLKDKGDVSFEITGIAPETD